MRFAICNELFEGWEFSRICHFVADVGYSGIEIAPYTLGKPVGDLGHEDRAAIAHVAHSAGIEIVGLHWLLARTEGYHVTHPDSSVRESTAAHLSELAALCADLGGLVLVFGSPKQRDVPPGITYDQAWKFAEDTFTRLLPTLEKTGVIFCLEPLSPAETNFINTADEALRMVGRIGHPNFRLLLDVKAMSSESRRIPDIIRSSAGYVAHFHANDANLRGPGFGDTDFRPIADALREIHYDGWISVEVFDFSPGPEAIAVRSLEYLKKFF